MNAQPSVGEDAAGLPPELALSRLLQLAAAALPVGAYSYSEGLEHLVEAGRMGDAGALERWLVDALSYGAPRMEAAVLLRMHRAYADGDSRRALVWDAWLDATRDAKELRRQGRDMARALWRLLERIGAGAVAPPGAAAPLTFAAAFAAAAAAWSIPPRETLVGYLHSWAANLVGAGVKLIPLGQGAGQAVLWNLNTAVVAAIDAACELADEDLDGFSAGAAVAAMRHEEQYSRLFRS